MTKQLNMFDAHERENNSESENHLNKNRGKFNAKCKQVYDRLMAGEELTVLQCANDGIASLPRRILDLRSKEVQISDKWLESGIKCYFMSPQQIEQNGEKFK